MPTRPPAVVAAYDPAWPAMFETVRGQVQPAVADVPATVEHVGSTAVPGLAAKPIIDVDVVVAAPESVPAALAALASLGYQPEGDLGVPGREALRAPEAPALPYHHLYVVVAGSQAHLDHVLLRDHLRAHPEAVAAYAARKRDAASLLRSDRAAYGAAKAEVVEALLAEAYRHAGRRRAAATASAAESPPAAAAAREHAPTGSAECSG